MIRAPDLFDGLGTTRALGVRSRLRHYISVDFPDIERNLAFLYLDGYVTQQLPPSVYVSPHPFSLTPLDPNWVGYWNQLPDYICRAADGFFFYTILSHPGVPWPSGYNPSNQRTKILTVGSSLGYFTSWEASIVLSGDGSLARVDGKVDSEGVSFNLVGPRDRALVLYYIDGRPEYPNNTRLTFGCCVMALTRLHPSRIYVSRYEVTSTTTSCGFVRFARGFSLGFNYHMVGFDVAPSLSDTELAQARLLWYYYHDLEERNLLLQTEREPLVYVQPETIYLDSLRLRTTLDTFTGLSAAVDLSG